jgi:prepilin-type processing-associated H-X9-DG protein
VLAADLVFVYRRGIGNMTGIDGVYFNHPYAKNPQLPGYQNVLYQDGHVQGFVEPYRRTGLTNTNFSVSHATDLANGNIKWGGLFFYEPMR